MTVFILILEPTWRIKYCHTKKDIHRYTLRMAKENSKIIYRGDWAREERVIMKIMVIKMVMIYLEKCFQLYLKLANFQLLHWKLT